jgi:hypothetical protein
MLLKNGIEASLCDLGAFAVNAFDFLGGDPEKGGFEAHPFLLILIAPILTSAFQ